MTFKRLFTVPAVLLTIQLLGGVAGAQAFLTEDNLAYPVQIVVPNGIGFVLYEDRTGRASP